MPTSIDAETRASGGPVEDPDHDDFQRVKFAQRIAETLVKRRSQKSIVVGLYGKWGEGKSSVLHFIKRSLADAPEVVVLNFNPWRFSDETQLLLNFFGELAKIIGQNLLNKKQRVIKGLSSYVAPLVPSLSLGPVSADIGKSFEALLKLAQPEIDKQREQIEQLIVESGKRVVVIIDDIDRLEKTQIQAVFRLVKLTADFNQTSYLLSFDDEMVARAIGEVFSSSADDIDGRRTLLAGQNFLEKIIQVPLRLPLARPDDLLQFCWDRLGEAFTETETTFDATEQERLISALRSAILPRLTTPRLAVRFANAVQFGLPLLRGEVNTVDQVLVEAMHIFFPELHHFVATHESDFVESLRNQNFLQRGEDSDENHKKLIDTGLAPYRGNGYRAGRALLCALFPDINRLYKGMADWSWAEDVRIPETELVRRKALASALYFPRYFAYSVVRGDVSDVEFEGFLRESSASQLPIAEGLVTRLGISSFLQKVQYQVQDLTSEQASSLWDVIAGLSPQFNGITYGPSIELAISHERQAAKLMISVLSQVDEAESRRQLIESLVSSTGTFYFAKELQYQLRNRRRYEIPNGYVEGESTPRPDRLFTQQEWQTLMDEVLPQVLLTRVLVEAGDVPLYKSHPFYAFNLLFIDWPKSERRPDVGTYIRSFLNQSPEDIHDLMAICSNTITMEGRNFLANITTQKVADVTHLLGSYLYDEARRALGSEVVTSYPGNEQDYEQPTPENRLRQFVYLYEKLSESEVVSELESE
ncbi:MAG: KAP family P-loop NTPase fold protein [Janthinobacterium lividum]